MIYKEKIIKHIFLDTTVFEECRYNLENKNMELLLHTAHQDFKIHITRVNEQEIKKHFISKYLLIKNKIKETLDKSGITKKYLSRYFDFIANDNGEYEKFLKDLQSSGIDIIETYDLNISLEQIFNDYFANNPPFSNNKEFPDSLILNSIYTYLNENNVLHENSHIISNDACVQKYCDTKQMKYFNNIPSFCSWLKNEKYPDEFQYVKKVINNHLGEISVDIIRNIDPSIFEAGYDDYWLELELENVEIKLNESCIDNYYIIDFNQEDDTFNIKLEVTVSLLLDATFTGANQNDADWYEKEYHYETYSFDEELIAKLSLIVEFSFEQVDENTFSISVFDISPLNSEELKLVPENHDD